MYYVIKKQQSPSECFIGFRVPKYIASKNNNNVIFEFQVDGKTTRKWVKKDDIVLLTEDKEFFVKTIDKFNAVAAEQQLLVNAAQLQFEQSKETYTETVNTHLNKFNEIKNSDDVPCILIDL